MALTALGGGALFFGELLARLALIVLSNLQQSFGGALNEGDAYG